MPDFMHSSSTAKSLQDFVDQKIIDLAKKSIFAARTSLISEARRKQSKTVDVAIDGCYNDTERIGVREVFEHTLLQIHHELPDAVIKIACDQDAKIRDPKNTNIFIDEERSYQLMIPMDHVAFVDDRAHISINVHGTFQRHLKTGSSGGVTVDPMGCDFERFEGLLYFGKDIQLEHSSSWMDGSETVSNFVMRVYLQKDEATP
ncbi:Oidioi.mRNA.OKI2018_I69.chr2.g4749.t1.cds [Oikopleura dioica]|uniref:Oidioi.mRNA.OKI2018_I69.chr2.g4749.t1.cds n=1 Tax=Oikopleura dioica TaxID=34765 RepID=A0ABN7T2L5_OIKDI|nr:Oidioi.mRNA.OKI2018_I69.chr2.g4749.t1.cds [Oikopleura dioica]